MDDVYVDLRQFTPPLKEQQRIISRLSALELLLKHYTELDLELDLLNQDVSVSLNKSILQEAIQGKLVPQIASFSLSYSMFKIETVFNCIEQIENFEQIIWRCHICSVTLRCSMILNMII